MSNKLKQKVMSGLAWRGMERFGTQAIQFALTVVLARLLEPKDFGTVALLTVFLALGTVFVNSGFGTAIIQKKEVEDRDLDSVLYLSLAISLLLYGLFWLSGPLVAAFYGDPVLSPVLRWMALGLILGAVNGVQNAVLTREMRFQASFWCNVIQIAAYGGVGVWMACAGYGVWSLVVGSLVSRAAGVVACWFLIGWRPRLQFCWATVRQLFGYSWKILAATLNDTLFTNLYNLIIGKLFNATMLGYYNRGQSIPMTVMGSVNATISGVIFPALSHCQDDPAQMRALTRRMITTSCFFVFPAMFGLAAVAEPLVRLLLTDKWLPCVPFLQLACVTYAFWPLHEANLQVLLACGRSDLFLKLEFVKKPLLLLVILLTYRHGVLPMVVGQALLSPLCVFVNAFKCKKLIGYSVTRQIRDSAGSFLLASLMALVVTFLHGMIVGDLLLLVAQTVTGVLLYFGLSVALRMEPAMYVVSEIRTSLVRVRG